MKKRLWTFSLLMLMVTGSFFFAFKPAVAQTGTTVFTMPDPATVYLNGSNSQVVEIWVGDVVELNAFDISVSYDPEVVHLDGWEVGDFLTNLSCFTPPLTPDYPGFLHKVCLQLAQPFKSGSGVLLELTFSGLGFDSTGLTLPDPSFSAGTPLEKIYPTPINGTLNVTYNATIKPTTLSGSFSLQGRVSNADIPVTLSGGQFVGQGPYTANTTNVSGSNLNFPSVAMDVYTVSTAQAGYLNITPTMGKQIALLASGNALPPLRLLAGNAVWTNNAIDIYDIALVSGEIGKTSFNLAADINNDGKVDIFDLALTAGNYGLTSALAYAGWTP